ncbi:plantaricin C family lantibiotic [Clostridium vincentii]|uniref:Lantibiotic lichenicidin VK21 A1 n=1 Tax=Clostridium vincentii TaxID=52704 RepID=A0A2T0BH65_9CLOT|nr:plantaricin C family lantibiotic [Clostridium vincentii]PRR83239.1 Lantibiotic lichenicidin VK21 A1 precursor [Clostridium vincentii]
MYNTLLKDPVLRAKIKNIAENPSGDAIAELNEQDLNSLAGAGIYSAISAYLGNKGAFCTITKECQANCN